MASVRRVQRFSARPVAAMTMPSSAADSTCIMRSSSPAMGWVRVVPPTMPTAMGSSIIPSRSPEAVRSQQVIGRYTPLRLA